MSHLLDTNICSAHFRRPAGLAHQFLQHSGRLFVPTVVLGELYTGAHHVDDPAPLLEKIADLLEDVHVLDFDRACVKGFRLWVKKAVSVWTEAAESGSRRHSGDRRDPP